MADDDRLASFGIRPASDEHLPEVHAECLRVALAVLRAGRRTIGLLPASAAAAVLPLAVHLGGALAEVSAGKVAVVAPRARWPELPAELLEGADPVFARVALRPTLALFLPRRRDAAPGVAELERLLRGLAGFGYGLIDLTDLGDVGERHAALKLLDGVVVLGRAGVTWQSDLVQIDRDLPPGRQLGVLLVGGRSS